MSTKRPTIYLGSAFARIYAQKWSFLACFVAVFFASFTALSASGVAPADFRLVQPPTVQLPTPVESHTVAVSAGQGELPVRIEIPAVDIKANVSNPKTTDIEALDQQLLAGAVRYPGTGTLGENGTVLLFGHSSHLPVVHNQAYKAFNDIQNLKEGDVIYVFGSDKIYTYAVETVQKENTATGAIPLVQTEAHLTLATCDNFATKSDRWVVDAVLVSVEDQKTQ